MHTEVTRLDFREQDNHTFQLQFIFLWGTREILTGAGQSLIFSVYKKFKQFAPIS